MSASTSLYDTIIAGAGPVGLFLACELALAGCAVLVLEREGDPSTPLKRAPFGLRGLTVPTLESLDRRGLLDALEAHAASGATPGTAHVLAQARRPGGHFAGIPFYHDRIDAARWPYRLPGPVSSIAAEMASIEAVLAARAEASGVTILRGGGVAAFIQTHEAVTVQAGGRRSGAAGSSAATAPAVRCARRRESASPAPSRSSPATRCRPSCPARIR